MTNTSEKYERTQQGNLLVVYVISGFSGPRIQIIDTMYPCAIGPIGQMVMVHQPLLLNQTVHKFVKVTLFHVT